MSTAVKPVRNLSMEVCKLFAAFCVVCLHVEFPNPQNELIAALFQFANPVFFCITGYFNLGATAPQLKRRLTHILSLYATAWAFQLLWGCVSVELNGGSSVAFLRAALPDANEVIWWLAYQQDNFLGQLWFLASTAVCYGVLWVYTQFFGEDKVRYNALYTSAMALFTAYFVLNILLPITDVNVSYFIYRNGWLFGLPMFCFGMFLHEHQERILKNFHLTGAKETAIAAFGFALTAFHVRSGASYGLPLGALVSALGIMLYLISHPTVKNQKLHPLIRKFAPWSTGIYLFHVTVMMAYLQLLQPFFEKLFGPAEAWLRCFLVFLLTLPVAMAWDFLVTLVKKVRK